MNSLINLSAQQLRQAANIQEEIASLEKELGRILEVETTSPDGAAPKRTLSAAARRKIAAAQRARWAKAKGKSNSAVTVAKSKGRRKMSAAAKAELSRKLKARWAERKAAKQ